MRRNGEKYPEVERRGAAEALVEPGLRQLGLLDAQAGQPLLPVGPIVDLDVLGVEPTRLVLLLGDVRLGLAMPNEHEVVGHRHATSLPRRGDRSAAGGDDAALEEVVYRVARLSHTEVGQKLVDRT